MRIDLTLTGVNTFHLEMTPLNNPAITYTKYGTLDGPAGSAIDWVEFELYNTDSDYYPTPTITGGETDFYISNMQIIGDSRARDDGVARDGCRSPGARKTQGGLGALWPSAS